MRVLFTTWAWPAHYYPQVPVAWALRAAGHDVRMTSNPALLPVMRASGLPSTPVGPDLDLGAAYRGPTRRVTAVSDLPPDEARATFHSFVAERVTVKPSRASRLSVYAETARAMTEDLLALGRSWRPDLVVFDPLTYAGPLVAQLLGVPAVRNLFGPDITFFTRSAAGTPVWDALLDHYGQSDVDLLGVATVDPVPPSVQLSDEVAPTRRLRTRYVPYNGLAEVPPLPQLNRPRLCLTWGTSTNDRVGGGGLLPDELLYGCAKLARERDADLVLAIAASQRTLLPELPDGVVVVESVPLDALLPTCTAIVHQGGAGTMLTALRHGLPQITATYFVDQIANGYHLVQAGAGLSLSATELTASDVLTAGHELLDSPAYGVAARAVRAEMLAQPAPSAIVDDLVALAAR